jgi:hypothetical protein
MLSHLPDIGHGHQHEPPQRNYGVDYRNSRSYRCGDGRGRSRSRRQPVIVRLAPAATPGSGQPGGLVVIAGQRRGALAVNRLLRSVIIM